MSQLKIVQFGCGKASAYTMKYAMNGGAEIVGAFDINPLIIGKDIGEIIGIEKIGVVVQDSRNAKEILTTLKPDACILTTMSLLTDIKEELLLLASLGINTVTSCEEAFYPWNSSKVLAKEIDKVAKENNCTICGTGYQDMSWCNLAVLISGSCTNIESIKIITSFNLDNYGTAPALIHGAGMPVDSFTTDETIVDNIRELNFGEEATGFMPSFAWNSNGWLCDRMELTATKQTQQIIPHTYDTTLSSKSLGMDIIAGYVVGMTAVVITETKEGPTIITESIGKVYTSNETDINKCYIVGEPNVSCELHEPANKEMACASIVARIPDIINSPAGFVSTSRMQILTYRAKPLVEYINKDKKV